jgi:urea transport system permease protein
MGAPRFIRLLEGPQTIGRGLWFWLAAAIVLLAALAYPQLADGYTVGNTVYFFTWTFMALGLCLIWGYGGTLSFGQTAFFGLSGYTYGVLTLNFGAAYGFTLFALVASLVVSACISAASAACSLASSRCR